jgi:pimeloyl-ACP methyl ester carboxylesterase
MAQRAVPAEPPPVVSGRWVLIAFLITLSGALICVYGTLCLLFYQGQWQMLFHPSRSVTATPATVGLPFEEIHFDVTETGHPQLDGWVVPAAKGAQYATATVLYLHDGRGSLSDTLPAVAELHTLGINVFAFDYRGFGKSTGRHPSERMARADAVAAWTYLTDTRHIPGNSIIVFGHGTGATFAAALGAEFAPAGVVLEDPNLPARAIFKKDARARIVPLSLLENEWLDPMQDVQHAHVPRMFLLRSGDPGWTRELFEKSSEPKAYFDLRGAPEATVQEMLRRFLDEVVR